MNTTLTPTTIDADEATDIVDSLNDDGDTFELHDGRVLRLKVEPDDCSVRDLWSEECYGKLAPFDYDYLHDSHEPRPANMNGSACKISGYAQGYWTWWQPPAETSDVDAAKRIAIDLLEQGFLQVGLELLDGTDAYGRPVVVSTAWLGGIDSLENGYLRDIVGEQLHELNGLVIA